MRLLITGGAGYVGSHLTLMAERAGHEVWIYDDFSNSSPHMPFLLGGLLGRDEVHYVRGDVRDHALLCQTMRVQKTDVVIHLAAKKYADESVELPLDYYGTNVAGTISVLTAMRNSKVRQLVFSSSAAVYGEQLFTPIDEQSPCHPDSPYGWSKLMAERIIRDSGINATCLRYFNPIGVSPGLRTPDDPSLMSVIMSVVRGQRKHMSVFGDDWPTRDGTAIRDFIHVEDVAASHLLFLERDGFEIFNVGTGMGVTVNEFITTVEQEVGRELPKEVVGRRGGDIGESVADVEFIRRVTGWKAERGLHDMVRSTVSAESSRLSSER